MKDDKERNERLKFNLAMIGIALAIIAILKLLF
jgi:hypothetical protein